MEFLFEDGELRDDGWHEEIFVPDGLRYLEGHFPGDPIVPGVAQVVALGEARARAAWPELGAAAGLKRLKFMTALRPGDRLALSLTRKGSAPVKVTMVIHKGDTLCSKGTLLFDPPEED
ncbi:MAG: hypothetical protein AAF411_07860 [Myxococcota bacterium]